MSCQSYNVSAIVRVIMAKKTTKQPRLTLHQLLVAISFWGSTTRLLLIAFVVGVIFALKMYYLTTTPEWELKVVIYILGSFALLDVAYVIVARTLPLKRRLDQLALLTTEAILGLAYVLPNMIYAPSLSKLASWSVLIVLLVLGVRTLLGLLFTSKK